MAEINVQGIIIIEGIDGILNINDTIQLHAVVLPIGATNKNVIWGSDDSSIATVEDGLVKAVSAGLTTITATTIEQEFTATFDLIINE